MFVKPVHLIRYAFMYPNRGAASTSEFEWVSVVAGVSYNGISRCYSPIRRVSNCIWMSVSESLDSYGFIQGFSFSRCNNEEGTSLGRSQGGGQR
jgi:hypothetical protein